MLSGFWVIWYQQKLFHMYLKKVINIEPAKLIVLFEYSIYIYIKEIVMNT